MVKTLPLNEWAWLLKALTKGNWQKKGYFLPAVGTFIYRTPGGMNLFENGFAMVMIILVINIVYVSFFTIRMILTIKGHRYIAALISMVEVIIYVIGLGLVLENLNGIQNLLAYAVGYGLGIIVGTKIEDKLALGYITVNVISKEYDRDLPKTLREQGYGVTSWAAWGLEGERLAMQILTPRKYEAKLYQLIKELDPKAFIIAHEPKTIYGGFWVRAVKRGNLFS